MAVIHFKVAIHFLFKKNFKKLECQMELFLMLFSIITNFTSNKFLDYNPEML